jgi:DNA-binding transcriptional regulator YbjK
MTEAKEGHMGSRRGANDPERRDRIAEAALAVIVEHGVHKTTHRKIAEEAAVPLGSVTYYFQTLDHVIRAAFSRLVASMSARYAAALNAAVDQDAACDAVTELICGEDYASGRELVAIYEMYSFANHDTTVRQMMADWVEASRASLSQHFSARACSALDALIEGWPIHRSLASGGLDRDVVSTTIRAVVHALP